MIIRYKTMRGVNYEVWFGTLRLGIMPFQIVLSL